MGQVKSTQSRVPLHVSELPNTPSTAQIMAKQEFAEIMGSPKVEASRYFVLTLVLTAAVIVMAVAIASMLPLKRVVPYMVSVSATTGEVMARPVEASVFKVDRVMIKAELRNWVEKLYTINADELVRENLRYVETRSKSEAVGQLANWRREEKVFERLLTAPQLKRDAKVTSIDVDRNDGVAFLTLLTVETGSPDTAPKRLRFTVNYVTEPSDREEVLTRNPLGFYVTHFSAAKELQ